MQRLISRLPICALLVATALTQSACDRSATEPDPGQSLTIERLDLSMSSTVALGRTVTPSVGAYASYSTLLKGLTGYFYPADSGAKAVLASSNASVVRVNDDATVTAIGAGIAYVTAALAGRRDSVLVSVAPGYELTLLPATDSITPVDINDAGDVAGFIYPGYVYPGTVQTGVLLRGGQRIDLGNCYPAAMNNGGQIACNQYAPGGSVRPAHPAIYDNGTITFPLGSADGAPEGLVTGISESGHLFGLLNGGSDPAMRGQFAAGPGGIDYRWERTTRSGKINSLLHGVGSSGPPCGYCQAMVFSPEGTSFPRAIGGRYGEAVDINDADDIIGLSEDMSIGGARPTLWRKASQWAPERFPRRVTLLSAISERGQVVGMGFDGAIIWDAGRTTFLEDAVQDPGWTFGEPVAINRSGTRIAARGVHPTIGRGIVVIHLP